MLFERIDLEIAPMRQTYEELMAHPGQIEDILLAGASKARQAATPFMAELRQVVGLRSLRSAGPASGVAPAAKSAQPSLKQYRESDGQFYFKLVAVNGDLLLQSLGFDSPKEAGALVARLKQGDASVLQSHCGRFAPVDDAVREALTQALLSLRQATQSPET
jgi:tryptophanyl-tRNA synthetase